jgi:hypothetical protein
MEGPVSLAEERSESQIGKNIPGNLELVRS